MKILSALTSGIALSVLLIVTANAGPNDAPAVPKDEGKALQADQTGSAGGIAPAKSGTSVVERDKKRYKAQKRAADQRAAEMKKADKARKPAKSGSSVVERDKKRYDIQKRAAAKRDVEMRKAAIKKEQGADNGKQDRPTVK